VTFADMDAMWAALHPAFRPALIDADPVLAVLYLDATAALERCEFALVPGTAPVIRARPAARPYHVAWAPAATLEIEDDAFSGLVLHALARATVAEMYEHPPVALLRWAAVSLPPALGEPKADGLAPNQRDSLNRQVESLEHNWALLELIEFEEHANGAIGAAAHRHVATRLQVAGCLALVTNDAILGELLYYLRAKDLQTTLTYEFAQGMLREANQRRRG
jgi:hypothetical protein